MTTDEQQELEADIEAGFKIIIEMRSGAFNASEVEIMLRGALLLTSRLSCVCLNARSLFDKYSLLNKQFENKVNKLDTEERP